MPTGREAASIGQSPKTVNRALLSLVEGTKYNPTLGELERLRNKGVVRIKVPLDDLIKLLRGYQRGWTLVNPAADDPPS